VTGVTVKPGPIGMNATSAVRARILFIETDKMFAEREKELQMFSALVTVMLTAGTIFYIVTV
jgi:hypothetical protein